MFCPPTFSRVDVLMHTIHWMIGAIFVKFSQLILMKVIEIVATRCQISRLICTQFNFGCVSALDPAGGAYSAAHPPRWI